MKEESKDRKGRGHALRHGGYAWLNKKKLSPDKKYILVYLGKIRKNLEVELGPMTESMNLILDRIIEKLGYLSLIQEAAWNAEPIIIEKGIVKLQPCLGSSYLAYSNSIRLDLEKLIELSKQPKTKLLDMASELVEVGKKEKENAS
ncbi:hypothetical protein ES707_12307 [subsurface metagenome]